MVEGLAPTLEALREAEGPTGVEAAAAMAAGCRLVVALDGLEVAVGALDDEAAA